MKKLLLILLCFPFIVFSQNEKRLALVIGNANYDKGELKNPVNDALLIAETLKKLEFDVILDTNLADKRSFKETIREFGNKRPDYDVAFVYYAGHGIQVGSENYLLPTKEVFQNEYDVLDYGVSVQDIMRYLTGMSNQVNILVLDACRDNPFEQNWNATRSLKGAGLAKIPPPTGSLIAFSTDAGNTAADGDGKNTVYCESLCKNMLLENTSLDQVFRNVRTDVLRQTNHMQSPVEESKLTGKEFYFKASKLSLADYLSKSDYIVSIPDGWIAKEFNMLDAYNSLEVDSATKVSMMLKDLEKNLKFPIQWFKYHQDSFPGVIPTITISVQVSSEPMKVWDEIYEEMDNKDSLDQLFYELWSRYFEVTDVVQTFHAYDISTINKNYQTGEVKGYAWAISHQYLSYFNICLYVYVFEYSGITYQINFSDILPGDYYKFATTYGYTQNNGKIYSDGDNGEDNSEIFEEILKNIKFYNPN